MSGRLQRFIASIGPTWIHERNIGAFLEAVGRTLDDAVQACYEGLFASNPLYCNTDALTYIARDRGIRLYDTEPEPSKRQRLSNWEDILRAFGTQRGMLINLHPYFLPGALPTIHIVHQAGDGSSATWHTISPEGVYSVYRASPSNFDFDGVDAKCSRWFAIVNVSGTRLDPLTAATLYDDGNAYDGGQVYDGIAASIGNDIMAILDEAKAAHDIGWALILTTTAVDRTSTAVTLADGSTSLPVGNWGSIIDPSTHAPTRPPYASFYFDLGQG